MTVNVAIAEACASVGDCVTREELCCWLGEIENAVVTEIAATHENDTSDKTVIGKDCEGDRILFAPEPYSRLYVDYLLMRCDAALRDTQQYANSAARFMSSFGSFADQYNRANMPLEVSKIKL